MSREAQRGTADHSVRAAATTLSVLEAVAFAPEEVGVTQIAAQIGQTKGSVFRHLQTLVDAGYLVQNPVTSRYRLGSKARLLGSLAPGGDDITAAAEGPMHDLRDQLGLTVVLSVPGPGGALVVKTILGPTPVEIGVRPGSELSYHGSAQGKVILAFGSSSLAERVLTQPLQAFTPHTITDSRTLAEELERTRSQGYGLAPDEAIIGINALSAPVFDQSGNCAGALAVVSSIQYVPRRPESRMIQAVKDTAARISRYLGYEPGSATATRHAS